MNLTRILIVKKILMGQTTDWISGLDLNSGLVNHPSDKLESCDESALKKKYMLISSRY